MKKITVVLLSLVAAIGMIACSSTSSMDGSAKSKKQAAINKSFEKVYSSYADVLVLDGAETYEVQQGDTLTSITKTFYAGKDENGYYFPLIMLASRGVVSDPELIEPGMKLTIPNFEKNINNKDIATKLKPYFKDMAEVYKQKDTTAAADIRPHLVEISEALGKDEAPATDAPAADAPATPEPEVAPAAEQPAAN